MDKGEKGFYSVREFADAIGYSTDRVYEWLRNDYIHGIRVAGKSKWMIPSTELQRLKSKNNAKKFITHDVHLREHFGELSVTALVLASNFESYLNAPGTDSDFTGKIGDVVYGGWLNEIGGVRDALSVEMYQVDKRIASNVLLHIKLEFPELTEIKDWADLIDDKITKNFVERLKLKANRGDFMGKCPDCPH